MEKTIYSKLLNVSKQIDPISKDSKNPFFKSKYFDVNALIGVVRPILTENNLVLLQPIKDGQVYSIIIDTDTSEQIESSLMLPNIQDPQKLGSAITYYRRYTLQSLLGLQAEDDDANAASKQVNKPVKTKLTDSDFKTTLEKGTKSQIQNVLDTFEVTDVQKKALMLTKAFTNGSK
jgi:hypothetical protein